MKFKDLLHIKKSRKHPIKRDEAGLSLRARCFVLFEGGKRPLEVVEELKMEENTVYRYYRDWKQLGPNFERLFAFVKQLFKKEAPDRDSNIEIFSKMLGIEKEQFETILSQPYGLRRFLSGRFYFPVMADADHKMHVALELAMIISDHLVKKGGDFEDVYLAIGRLLRDYQKNREEVDIDVREDNKVMKFIHAVLAADLENERKGRIKPDTLSEEERGALIKKGIESEMKKTEQYYWFRIGILAAGGLTREEAREKIYQDILEKGDSKVAKMFREFQDKIHPLKSGEQSPPSSDGQAPI